MSGEKSCRMKETTEGIKFLNLWMQVCADGWLGNGYRTLTLVEIFSILTPRELQKTAQLSYLRNISLINTADITKARALNSPSDSPCQKQDFDVKVTIQLDHINMIENCNGSFYMSIQIALVSCCLFTPVLA